MTEAKQMTVKNFCEQWAVSRTTAYREAAAGRLRFTKVGRATRIAASDAEAWAASLPKTEVRA